MDLSGKNSQCLDKDETLVGEKYKAPVDDKFENVTDFILLRLKEPEDCGETILTQTLTLTLMHCFF